METATLLTLLDTLPILDAQGRRLLREAHAATGPETLLRNMVTHKALTRMQANWLLKGRGEELILGPFTLLDKLGEGGMGVVYRALHRELGRVQAVKLIGSAGRHAIPRIRREARSMAALHHTNIVGIHDAGQAGERFYLAMEFVPGQDLYRVVHSRGPLPPGQACDIILQAAMGMQHAHEQSLVHRDIKPANILLTPDGVAKVADLGLASWREDGPQTRDADTPEGAVLGTPDYMAPEQANDPRAADIRADVYSLGCTLYFLLCGSPPFPGGTMANKIVRHEREAPAPLGGLPPGLWEVISCALAKKPQGRPSTPGELAQRLKPFVGAAAPAAHAIRVEEAQASTVAHDSETLASPPRRTWWPILAGVAVVALIAAVWALLPRGEKPRPDSDGPPDVGLPPAVKIPPLAPERRRSWHPTELVTVLGDDRWRHWDEVRAMASDARGKRVASRGNDGVVRVWNAATGESVAVLPEGGREGTGVAISDDGDMVAAGGTGQVWLWKAPDWKPARFPDQKECVAVAFLPDGTLVSAGRDGKIRVREVLKDDVESKDADSGSGEVLCLATAPGLIATGDEKGQLRLIPWPPTGPARVVKTTVPITAITVAGSRVVTASKSGTVVVWDARTGNHVVNALNHKAEAVAVAFSRDGQWLASAGWDETIHIRDMRDMRFGKHVRSIKGRWQRLRTLAFLAGDPTVLLAAGEEGHLAAWNPVTGEPARREAGHCGPVQAMAWLPDGRLATGADDRVIRLWDLPTGKAREIPLEEGGQVMALVPFGGLLASGGKDENVHLFDTRTGEAAGELKVGFWVYAMSPLPGGRLLLGGKGRNAEIWDVAKRSRISTLNPHRESIWATASEGERHATGDGSYDGEGTARVIGDSPAEHQGHFGSVTALGLKGGVLASGDRKGVLRLDGKPAGSEHPQPLSALAWSPDGRRLATACEAGKVMWRDQSGKVLKTWTMPGAVHSLLVSPDGKQLVTGNGDGTVFVLRLP